MHSHAEKVSEILVTVGRWDYSVYKYALYAFWYILSHVYNLEINLLFWPFYRLKNTFKNLSQSLIEEKIQLPKKKCWLQFSISKGSKETTICKSPAPNLVSL